MGHFNDTDTYSLMLGSRYYVPTGNSWRVFGGAALGATRLHDMTGTLDIPDSSTTLAGLRFARATTVFSQSVEAGIDYQAPQNVDLQFTLAGSTWPRRVPATIRSSLRWGLTRPTRAMVAGRFR